MVPGGIINYITKRPLTEESITIGQEFGSWGSRTTDIDASIPLTQDKRWLSRTIISTDQLAGFQKDINNHHFNGSVIIQGKPKDDTTYTLIGNYNNYNLVGGAIGALPSVGTIAPPYGIVPYDGNYFNPDYRYYFIGRSITGRVEHKINDIWSVTSSLRYSSSHNDRSQLGGYSWANPGYTTGKILSTYKWDVFNQDSLAWDTTGNAKFKTGGLDHNLVLGYGWARFNRDWPISVYKNFTGVDIYNPIWDPRPVLPLTPWIQGNGHTYNRSSYLSDTVSISDKLKVTGGISRASYYESFGGREQSAAGNTWRLGTTYETKPGVTLFTGYSTSFDFNSSQTIKAAGQNIGTQFFKPKTGNQLEGGIKYDVSDKASVTLSVYDIHQRNIVNNAGTSNDTNWELIGEQESKGIELDASYVIRPGWNLLAAFSNAKSRIVEDALHPEYVGKQAVSVPTQTLKLWSTYEFQDGPRKGWGFGGGITHVSDRAFDTVNSLWVPGFTTIDGIVYYKTQDWSYSLNLYNLTNRQYWVGQTSSGVFAGTPRSFTFRAERTF
jgi:iron complex outermembrane receptor protein